MKPWLLFSFGFLVTLTVSGCTMSQPSPPQATLIPSPSISSTSDVSYTDDLKHLNLDKPLPELDEIEALLKEYSGTDVK